MNSIVTDVRPPYICQYELAWYWEMCVWWRPEKTISKSICYYMYINIRTKYCVYWRIHCPKTECPFSELQPIENPPKTTTCTDGAHFRHCFPSHYSNTSLASASVAYQWRGTKWFLSSSSSAHMYDVMTLRCFPLPQPNGLPVSRCVSCVTSVCENVSGAILQLKKPQ